MKKICIVVSNYSSEITNKLYNDAIKELKKYKKIKIKTFKAPGSFEIPVIISRNIKTKNTYFLAPTFVKTIFQITWRKQVLHLQKQSFIIQ